MVHQAIVSRPGGGGCHPRSALPKCLSINNLDICNWRVMMVDGRCREVEEGGLESRCCCRTLITALPLPGDRRRALGAWRDEAMARAARVSLRSAAGTAELQAGGEPPDRARRPGWGPSSANADPGRARPAGAGGTRLGGPGVAVAVVDPVARNLAAGLTRQGHRAGPAGGEAAEGRRLQPGQRQDRPKVPGTPNPG